MWGERGKLKDGEEERDHLDRCVCASVLIETVRMEEKVKEKKRNVVM